MTKLFKSSSLFAFLFTSIISFGQLDASFFTNPNFSNGQINVCQGSTVLFTMSPATQTNISSLTTIAWTFTGANISTSNSQGPIPVVFNSSGTATLILTEGTDADTMVVNVNVSTPPFTPTLSLSPLFTNFSASVFNGVTVFKNCNSIDYMLRLNFDQVLNCSNVSSININWGVGNPQSQNFPCGTIPSSVNRNYGAPGNYSITYRVNFLNGCSFYGYYQVQIGNGQINLSTSASNFACSPGVYPLSFDQQFPGNSYLINWGDGTTSTFSYPNLPISPLTIDHTYLPSTCTGSTPGGYPIQITSTNECGPSTNSPAPIYISNAPTPQISQSIPDNTVCVGTSITFTDNSIPGIYINSTTTCSNTYNRYWFTSAIIAPNTLSGTLGTYGIDGSAALTIAFNQPGTYSVSLVVYNNSCEPDTITKTICVVPPVDAAFTIPTSLFCAPYSLTPVNTSSTPTCNITNAYTWTVTSTNPQNCTTNNGPSSTPAISTLQNPNFTLNGPGVYSIKLKLNLNPLIYGSQCAADSIIKTITIKDKPAVTLPSPSTICLGSSFTPLATANSCYGEQALSYAWNFNPNNTVAAGNVPTPSSFTSLTSGSVLYPNYGTFPYSFSATNECGTTTAIQNITVQQPVIVTPGTYGATCKNSPIVLAGSVTGSVTTGTWSAIPSGGLFTPNATALNATYTPPPNHVGNVTLTLTSGTPPAPCPVVQSTTTLTFENDAISTPGTYPNGICMNGSIQLSGSVGGAASSGSWTTNIAGGTFTPNANTLTATYSPPSNYVGNIVFTLTTNDPAGPCLPATNSVTVVVKPLPIATITPDLATICSGGSKIFNVASTLPTTSYSWSAITPLPTGITSPTSGTIASPNASFNVTVTNTSNATQTVYYVLTPTTNGCAGIKDTASLTIQPVATVQGLTPITVCPGALIAPSAFTSNPSGATFVWANSNPAIGLVASGTGNIASWSAPSNATNSAITGTINVTPTYNACPGTTAPFVVTINPTPSITNSTLSQTKCSGVATTLVTWTSGVNTPQYTWSGVSSSSNLSGFTGSGSGNLPAMTIVNTGSTIETVTYTVFASKNGCNGPSIQYVITVNPTPQLTLSANQTKCGGVSTDVTSFVNSVSGGSFTWTLLNPLSVPNTITGHPTSGTGQIPATIINNSGTAPVTLTYQVTPTANGCPGPALNYTITVNPAPVTQFSIPTQTICQGTNSQAINLTSATSNVSFAWSTTVPTGIGNITPTNGTGNIPVFSTITNSTNANITVTFSAFATTSSGASCAGSPATATIIVKPTPVGSFTYVSNDTICSNTQANINLSSTVTGTTYTWTAANGTGITGATNSIGSPTSIQQTLQNSSLIVSSATYTVTPTALGCQGATYPVQVFVNPIAVVTGLIPITVCPGALIAPSTFTSNPSGATFVWANSNPAIGLVASGTGNIASWSAPANATNSAITATINVTPTYNACPGTTAPFVVTINPTPIITNASLSQTICSGSPTSAVNWTSGVNGTIFNWTAMTNSIYLTGFNPSGTGNLPVITTILNSSNTIDTLIFSVIPTKNGCNGPTFTYKIIVNPTPVISRLSDQIICGGTSTILTNFLNSVSNGSFNWNLTNSFVPLSISGHPTTGTGQFPSTLINNSGTAPYDLIYQVTPTANGCLGSPLNMTITVNPAPTVQFSIPNQAVCTGLNSTLVNLSSTTSNVTFAWSAVAASGIGNFTGTTGTSSIPSFPNLTNTGTTPLAITFTAIATTSGLEACPGAPNTYVITVNPAPNAIATFVSNDTICSNTSLNIALTSTTANTNFTWTATNGVGISGGTNSTVAGVTIQQTLTNTLTTVGQIQYLITPSASLCPGTPITVTAYINPVAQMTGLVPISVCPTVNIAPASFTSNPPSQSFTWVNSNPTIGLVASGTGNIVAWNAPANNTLSNISGSISVTPIYNGCAGSASPFIISIYPTPSVSNSSLVQTICGGNPSLSVPLTSTISGSTINWNYSSAGSNLSNYTTGNGSGTLPVMTINNSGSTQQDVIYTVQAISSNNCPSSIVNYTTHVNPIPIVTLSADQIKCSGTATTVTSFTNSVIGGSYTWNLLYQGLIPSSILNYTLSGIGQISPMTITNSGANPYTLYYQVIPTANGCSGLPDTIAFTINPAPVVTFSPSSQSICSGETSAPITINSITPNVTYSWSITGVNGLNGATPLSGNTNSIPSFTLSHNGFTTVNLIVSASVSTQVGGCPGSVGTYTIAVKPIPLATATVNSTNPQCSGETALINLTSTVIGTSFTWSSVASAGVSGNTSSSGTTISNTLSNATASDGTVMYTITPTANSCQGLPISSIITVHPIPDLAPINSIAVCPTNAITPATFSTVPAGCTYTWTNTSSAIGINTSGTGQIASWNAPANNSLVNLTSLVSVKPYYFGCPGDTSNFTVTIYPTPLINSNPLVQTVCENDATTAVTFTNTLGASSSIAWTNLSAGSAITGFIAGNGLNPLNSMTLLNNGPTQQDVIYSIQATSSKGCLSPAVNYTIHVNPRPIITIPNDQTVCSGVASALVGLTADVALTTYAWQVITAPPVSTYLAGYPLSGIGNINPLTLTNTSNASQIVSYQITPSAAGCSGTAGVYTYTVNPSPSVTFSLPSQAICSESSTALVDLSTSTPNATISWTASVPAGLNGFTTTSGTNQIPSFNLTNTTSGILTATITATASTTGNSICPGGPVTYTIAVSPKPALSVNVVDSTLCSNQLLSVAITSPVIGTTFTWTATPTAGISGSSNGTGSAISQTLSNSQTVQGSVVYSITTVNPVNNVCPIETIVRTITIEPVPHISFSGQNQSLCSNLLSNPINLTSDVTGATISWSAANPSNLTGLTLSGTTTIPAQTIINSGISAATITYTAQASINSCSGPSSAHTIQVFPLPIMTINLTDDTICSNTAVSAQLTSNIPNTSFNWSVSPNVSISGMSNGTGSSINQVLTNSSPQIQSLVYTITPTAVGPTVAGCSSNSSNFSVSVNPVPGVSFSIANQTICSGTPTTSVAITSLTTNAQIAWTAAIPAGISGGQLSGSTSIPVQTLINTTNAPINIVYTVNVATTTGACSGSGSTYTITVNPIPVLSFSETNQIICSGVNTNPVNLVSSIALGFASGNAFSWNATQPTGVIGISTNGTTTIPAQLLTNSTFVPITVDYISSLSFTYNNTVCSAPQVVYSIIVKPLPNAIATPVSTLLCSGETTSVALTSSVANPAFTYSVLSSGAITGASNGSGNTISQTLVNNSLVLDSVIYQITATAAGCSGPASLLIIKIKPNPIATELPNVAVCPTNSIGAFNFTSTPVGATYAWTNSSNTIGLGLSGTGNIPIWNAPANVSGGTTSGIISVTPTLNGCIGLPMNFTVSINPTPTLTILPLDDTICSGTATSIVLTSNVSGATFNWAVSQNNATGASSSSGNTINQTLLNSSTTAGYVTYTITVSTGNCIGNTSNTTIVVHPIPSVTLSPISQEICSNTLANILVNSSINNANLTWSVSANNAITGSSNGTGSTISQTLINTATTAQSITYSVTPSLNGCTGTPISATVQVNPIPVLTISPTSDTICSGETTAISFTSSVLNTTFSYTPTNTLPIIGEQAGIGNTLTQQLSNTSAQLQNVQYTVTPTAASCSGSSSNVTIYVNPVATVTASLVSNDTICSGEHAIINLSSSTNGALFNWTASVNNQITGESNGQGNQIDQILTNTSFVLQIVNYSITPKAGTCNGTPTIVPIYINPLPQIIPGVAFNTCLTSPIFDLTGYSPAGGTWTGTGITNGINGTFNPLLAGVGPQTLTYTYTDPITGCTNSATRVVTVRPLPVPLFTADTLTCIGSTVNFTNTSTGASTYAWNFGDGGNSTLQNPSHSYASIGNYSIVLTATSIYGCVDSIAHNIHVITTPIASFTPSTHEDCGPLVVTFTNNSTGENITNYNWNFATPSMNNVSTLMNPTAVTYPSPIYGDTLYQLSLTVNNICGSSTFLDSIIVKARPIADFVTTSNTGCSPVNVGFMNTSFGSPTSYSWNFGDGSPNTTLTNPSHPFITGTGDTTFVVALIAYNTCGSDTLMDTITVFPNTVTSFFNTTPVIGCSPLPVQFTNYSIGATNYSWLFGDGQVSSTFSPNYTYNQAGTYVAKLIVDNGCSIDTSEISIIVHDKPMVDFTILEDTLCMNEAFSFTNTSDPLSNTFWQFGDGTTSNVYSPSHVFVQSGTLQVTLLGTSLAYGCTNSVTHTVVVRPTPNLTYDNYNYVGCIPLSVPFNETSNTANYATWDFQDGTIGIGVSTTHVYSTAGTYYPIVITQNNFGCSDTTTFNVFAHPNPVSDFTLSATESCDYPFTISTNNLSTGANAYFWDFDNTTTSNWNAPTVTYLAAGDYDLSLITYNQFGCSDTSTQLVQIHEKPQILFSAVDPDGCEDFEAEFVNSSLFADSYTWSFGDGSSSTLTNPTHLYTDPNVYSVTLFATNADGCTNSYTATNYINVYQTPVAGFNVTPVVITTDHPMVYLENTAAAYSNGFYDFGNGYQEDIDVLTFNYSISDSGFYLITQIVNTPFGCADTAYNTIRINLSPTHYVPNSFTPDDDGMNDTWNPVLVYVKKLEVLIFNRWGEVVFRTNEIAPSWDGKSLLGIPVQDGTYSYRITGRDGNNELIDLKGHINLIR
ncbi:MAG: gliding motility-associated C-terminal domain-containing protein [Crocinitomicaceae bacterium]|nr:gliding motility-associated C-terminal domain-containing protein [Crocinitomicaceae bacterium]